MSHVCLGIDPDLHSTALALVTKQRVLRVMVVRSKGDDAEDAAISMIRNLRAPLEIVVPLAGSCVIESQQIYVGKSAATPADIISLAHVSGGLIATCSMLGGAKSIWLPTPRQWKGQVPKPISHARSFRYYGIACEVGNDYCWPSGCATAAQIEGYHQVNRGDWKHLGDAMGLALWGCLYQEKR